MKGKVERFLELTKEIQNANIQLQTCNESLDDLMRERNNITERLQEMVNDTTPVRVFRVPSLQNNVLVVRQVRDIVGHHKKVELYYLEELPDEDPES